jgi:hypothetical protein
MSVEYNGLSKVVFLGEPNRLRILLVEVVGVLSLWHQVLDSLNDHYQIEQFLQGSIPTDIHYKKFTTLLK